MWNSSLNGFWHPEVTRSLKISRWHPQDAAECLLERHIPWPLATKPVRYKTPTGAKGSPPVMKSKRIGASLTASLSADRRHQASASKPGTAPDPDHQNTQDRAGTVPARRAVSTPPAAKIGRPAMARRAASDAEPPRSAERRVGEGR